MTCPDTALSAPNELFVSWQDAESRLWFVIGRLAHTPADGYLFHYTQGVKAAQGYHFEPLAAFPDLRRRYTHSTLFAAFQNRILSANRPEYGDFLNWLAVPGSAAAPPDPLLLLDRTNGIRRTDPLELFRRPLPDATGRLTALFFVRGIRHRNAVVQEAIFNHLLPGQPLRLALDVQNPRDPEAVLITTDSDIFGVGYIPHHLRHLAHDQLRRHPATLTVEVVQVNPPPAPSQLHLLCRLCIRDIPFGAVAEDFAYQPYPQSVEYPAPYLTLRTP